MTCTDSTKAIVVGIDGSDAAVEAARWAVEEAVSRDLPLRLVHVIEPGSEAVRLEIEYAEIALATARAAVEAAGRDIGVETTIKRGGIEATLAEESCEAEMLCIGSSATKNPAEPWGGGFTTTALIRSAGCRLAVVGFRRGQCDGDGGCVAIIVDSPRTGQLVRRESLTEARLRKLFVVVLEAWSRVLADPRRESCIRRLAAWQATYPYVEVQFVAARTDVVASPADIRRPVSMAIVDATECYGLSRLTYASSNRAESARSCPGLRSLPLPSHAFAARSRAGS